MPIVKVYKTIEPVHGSGLSKICSFPVANSQENTGSGVFCEAYAIFFRAAVFTWEFVTGQKHFLEYTQDSFLYYLTGFMTNICC